MTLRLITELERPFVESQWPEVFGDMTIPPDGLIKQIRFDDVVNTTNNHCIFAFGKTNGEVLLIVVDDIWSSCSRQALPAPKAVWEEWLASGLGAGGAWNEFSKALMWAVVGLGVVLLIQSGLLGRSRA